MARTAFADHPVEGAVAAGVAGGASENPLLLGGNDGGGLRRALLTDTNGVLQVGSTGTATTQVVGNVASAATDSGNPVKVGGIYNSSPPSFATGQRGDMQLDSAGNVKETLATLLAGEDLTNNVLTTTHKAVVSSTYSPSSYQSSNSGALVVKDNIKNAAGNLLGMCAVNLNAATRYLWITNAPAAPANALASSDATVLFMIAMPTLTTLILPTGFFTVPGKNFSAGISYGFSTSATSYTAGTATDHTAAATYV